MAVLGKIREKSMLLIVIIALGLFAFVVDPTTIMNFFNGSQNKDYVGKINDKTINRVDFNSKVEQMKARTQDLNGALNQAWDQEVRQALLEEQYDELGLSIEKDQLWDIMKQVYRNNPTYQNENGEFDENILRDQLAEDIKNNPKLWLDVEKQYANFPKQQTYFNLIRAGIGATEKDGEQAYRLENDKVDLKFVQVPYTSIADSTIEVSTEEITAYINKHKDDYKVDSTTDIGYVLFEEKPSAEDDAVVLTEINALIADKDNVFNQSTGETEKRVGFANTSDIALFLAENSDIAYDTIAKTQAQIPTQITDSIFKMEKGQLTKVYKEGDYYKVSRIEEFSKYETRNASHVLVAYKGATRAAADIERTEEEAEQLAKEYLAELKKPGTDFAEFAKEKSNDPTAATNGGSIGFIDADAGFAQEFKDYMFANDVDKMDVVKTDFGYHIIKVTEIKVEDKVKLATLALKVNPSQETLDKLYRDAQNLEIEAKKDPSKFSELAQKYGLSVMPMRSIGVLSDKLTAVPGNQRTLVKWTFNEETNVNDVKRFDADNGHIIAKLEKRVAEGLAKAEDVSVTVLPKVRQEKKVQMIMEKNSATTLAEFAQNNNLNISTATAISMKAPNLPGAGNEPKVVGKAFSMENGQVSKLIEGDRGVYMVEVTNITPAAAQDSYKKFADQTTLQNTSALGNKVVEALKKNAELEDLRADSF